MEVILGVENIVSSFIFSVFSININVYRREIEFFSKANQMTSQIRL
jgi:hypothetical protein